MEKLQPRWPPSWKPQGGSSVWTWFLQNQPKVARRSREMQPNSSSSSSLAFSIFTPWITLFSYVLGLHRSAPWGQNSGSRCISRVFLSTLLCLVCIFCLTHFSVSHIQEESLLPLLLYRTSQVSRLPASPLHTGLTPALQKEGSTRL